MADIPVTEQAPTEPIPVNPWRVPPSGSLGDDYDAAIQLDVGEQAKASGERSRRRRTPKRRPDEIVFLQWTPPLHWAVVLAWIFAAMSLLSTGPLYALMSIWASFSILSAAGAVILLRTVHRQNTGEKLAIGAGCVALVLVGLDLWRPDSDAFENYFIRAPRAGALPDAIDPRDQINERMQLMARIAGCAWLKLGDEAIEVGSYSVNSGVDPRSVSFAISTLSSGVIVDPSFIPTFPGERRKFLPRDPYSDDSYATFGVYVTNTHLLVYSPGPDGDWDINPRAPLPPEIADPVIDLKPLIYDEMSGDGDIILIMPLESVEEWAECDTLVEQFRK
ncbi:hypothetical protein KQI84_04225 [bacterium]|nr:hypothetical protein [bacterium]